MLKNLTNYIENLASITKYNVKKFGQQKKDDLGKKINLKVENLKPKIKPFSKKSTLCDSDVLAYLATLHRNSVVIPIDKPSN